MLLKESIFEIGDNYSGKKDFLAAQVMAPCNVHDTEYDYIGVQGEINEFCIRQMVSRKSVNNIRHVFEEICERCILSSLAEPFELYFIVEYSSEKDLLELRLEYSGRPYDPFTEGDDISVAIAMNGIAEKSYEYREDLIDRKNRIRIRLKS